MRTILLCIALLLSGMLTAQTIDHPTCKVRLGSISNITRIERTPEVTRVFIHAIFRPHWWIKEEKDSYLEDVATGTKYPLIKAEGIELQKETYMPDSGEMNYILSFAPLPKTTTSIHLLSPTSRGRNTYDISLINPRKVKASPLKSIKGNWYSADHLNRWEYGIYDSICIIQNRFFTNESIRQKGKKIEIVTKSKDGLKTTLLFTPQKDGNYLIKINGANENSYTRQKNAEIGITAEDDFKEFFRKDTAYLQGYIDGYDPRLEFETGLVYLDNTINRDDFPTVIKIHPNGRFEGKLVLNHPVESYLSIARNTIPFYIEPGQTLTMYLNWESILEYERARNYDQPIKDIEYMGPSAPLSRMYRSLKNLIFYPYEQLSKDQKELTPSQFKEKIRPVFTRWKQIGDSLALAYGPSVKATHLLKNKIALKEGSTLFNFLMSRGYYAKQDTANQALKVKEEDSYYDFLKNIPVNDEVMLADDECNVFINRFEYMNPLQKARYGNRQMLLTDSLKIAYPTKPLLTFFKEKGVKLTPEQEVLRIKQEKLAGKTLKVNRKEYSAEMTLLTPLYKTEKELVEEHSKTYLQSTQSKNSSKTSDKEINNTHFTVAYQFLSQGDSIVSMLSGQPNALLWQIACVRNLKFDLKNYKTREGAQRYIDTLFQHLTSPILIAESQRILETVHPVKAIHSYQLPESKGTEIFRNIIKAHAGKILFVDFWATSCGPCRSGIEATAQLRKKYKDHPEFEFIYITNQKESPQGAYNAYVAKNLHGEASYRVSETEFNYLRELFKFNGIPHYELIEKDGSVSVNSPSTWNLGEYLNNRFKESDKR